MLSYCTVLAHSEEDNMTNMKPLKIPKSQWEAFIIPIQDASIWAKAGLISVLVYLVFMFVSAYFAHQTSYNFLYFLVPLFVIWLGIDLFCSWKDQQLKDRAYADLLFEEETGIEVQEETKYILKLFATGKINEEEFNSRMANVLMTIESGRRFIPKILLTTAHKTIQ